MAPLPSSPIAATLRALSSQLLGGQIGITRWALGVAGELKDAHIAQAIAGAGGRQNMTPRLWLTTTANLADEYKHLYKLAQAVNAGTKTEAQLLASMDQYANAAQQAYWNTWKATKDNPDWAALPLLTQVPGDGNTACHGNCYCSLEEQSDGVHWLLGPSENKCGDCPPLAAGGPYRVV